ncbi:MAG: nuclear transport factor 2 family protein [Pseudomonadota bacterium]
MDTLPKPIVAYLKAYNAKDVPAMVDCLSDDALFRNISEGAVTAETHGKQAFEALAEQGAAAFSERRQDVTNAITVADTTLMEVDFTATVAMDLPNGWKAGQTLRFSGRSAVILKNDKIISLIDEA